jgi:two-component system, NarL family, nitrate/nitrite response regulator NarL
MSEGTIRLAVIDDHPLFREGVTRSLTEIGDFEVIGEGGSAEDALRVAAELKPDILLMDISMPGGGLDAVTSVLERFPEQKIVMLTVSEANEHIAEALNNGAKGYVLKGVGSKTLAEILRTVASGESYLSPVLSARLLSNVNTIAGRGEEDDPLSKLTDRESEILANVAAGLSNKRVALQLELQEKTIKHHMTRIMSKLNVSNRLEAAMMLRDAKDREG